MGTKVGGLSLGISDCGLWKAWGIEHRAWGKRFDLLDLSYLIDLNDLNGFNDFNDLTNRQFD
jgi:hypothetical protein